MRPEGLSQRNIPVTSLGIIFRILLYFIRTCFLIVLHFAFLSLLTIQTSMPPAGFEPAIPASDWPQTLAVNRSVTGIGGIEPAIFRLIARCLNRLRHRVLHGWEDNIEMDLKARGREDIDWIDLVVGTEPRPALQGGWDCF